MTEQLKRHMVRSRDMHEWNYTCPDEKYACSEVVLYSDHAAAVAAMENSIANERVVFWDEISDYRKSLENREARLKAAIAERDAAIARLSEAEKERAAIARDMAELKAICSTMTNSTHYQLATERDAALARLAEVEMDAARYRWLRDEADASTVEHMWHTTAVADTDAAIDAQLALSQEPQT